MSNWKDEYVIRVQAMRDKRKILGQRIYDSAMKIETLLESLGQKSQEEQAPLLDEIRIACVGIRVYLEEIQ